VVYLPPNGGVTAPGPVGRPGLADKLRKGVLFTVGPDGPTQALRSRLSGAQGSRREQHDVGVVLGGEQVDQRRHQYVRAHVPQHVITAHREYLRATARSSFTQTSSRTFPTRTSQSSVNESSCRISSSALRPATTVFMRVRAQEEDGIRSSSPAPKRLNKP
jgi:hypothetical protein